MATTERLFGYFGSSTGAASALRAAVHLPRRILGVVSRGGRTDLVGDSLSEVWAAKLLIVGQLDEDLLTLNQEASEGLPGPKSLIVIESATHLFEDSGTLGEVAAEASHWFWLYLLPVSYTIRLRNVA